MKALNWIAGIVLFLEMPIPLYWLVLHTRIEFWRNHLHAGYAVAVLGSWVPGGVLLFAFRDQLFAAEQFVGAMAVVRIAAGLALVAAEGYLLYRVERELGSARLVGHEELRGGGALATEGLYARMRHPRYTGMMAAVLGGCLLAGTWKLWVVLAGWWLLALVAIGLEERELRRRFGEAYATYSQRVPRFLPIRFRPRPE